MPAPKKIDVDEALELWADGWTQQELADRYGVRQQSIAEALDRHRARLRLGTLPTITPDEYNAGGYHVVGRPRRWADIPWDGPGARFPGASHREDA